MLLIKLAKRKVFIHSGIQMNVLNFWGDTENAKTYPAVYSQIHTINVVYIELFQSSNMYLYISKIWPYLQFIYEFFHMSRDIMVIIHSRFETYWRMQQQILHTIIFVRKSNWTTAL